MSTKVGDIFVRANLDQREYEKGLNLMQKQGVSVASAIGKKMAVALSVAGLAKFAKQCTEAGASLNAMGTIIDASLPHMTKQVDAFAKSAGKAFGLSETQAKGFVGKFASMAHAMGYTEQQAYAMSTSLAGLAGDLASYYHISQDEAFTKLGAVFTGETESLKSLGVVMTQNALESFAMANGINRSWSEMSELEKTSLRYQFILNSLSLAQGDFSKYSDTWSGSLATIRLNWQNFMATVGQGIINILLPLMQVIAKLSNVLTWLGNKFLWLTRLITGKDAEVGTSLDNTFGTETQDMFNDTGVSLGNIGSGLKGTGSNAKKAKKEVQALKREMMGFDKITKLTGKQDTATGTTGASGVGGGGGGGVGGVGDLGDLQGINDLIDGLNIPQETTDSWNGWKKVVADALDLLLTVGKTVLDDIVAPLLGLVTKHIIPTAFDILGTALKNIVDLATSFPKWLLDLFTNGDKNVKIDVDDKFTPKWNEIKKLADVSLNVPVGLQKNFGSNNNTVADWIVNSKYLGDLKIHVGLDRGFVGTVADWLKNNNYIGTVIAPVGLTPSFGGGITKVSDWLKQTSIWGSTVNFLIGLQQNFGSGITTVEKWLRQSSILGSTINFTIGLASGFGATVADWIKNNKFIGGLANGFGKATEGVINFGVELFTSFGKGIATVSDWIKDHLGGKSDKANVDVGVGLEPNFGTSGSGKKASTITTVSDWIKKKAWGGGVFKPIGLKKPTGKKYKWKTVKGWIESAGKWGAGVFKSIGLKKPDGKYWWNTVTDWVKSRLGKGSVNVGVNLTDNSSGGILRAKGGVYNKRWRPIQSYASGGLPNGSQLFWAREAGPELVGTLGGHTAVMNNDQIVASVSNGVAKAIAGIHFKMVAPRLANTAQPQIAQVQTQTAVSDPQMIALLTEILKAINAQDTSVYLDGEAIKNNVVKRINNHTRATGQLELIV